MDRPCFAAPLGDTPTFPNSRKIRLDLLFRGRVMAVVGQERRDLNMLPFQKIPKTSENEAVLLDNRDTPARLNGSFSYGDKS
jgi:hypothetical protein